MKYHTLIFFIALAGCQTHYVPQIPQRSSCIDNLNRSYLQLCEPQKRLDEESTFEQLLEDNAKMSISYKTCAEKVRVLQETLLACEKTR